MKSKIIFICLRTGYQKIFILDFASERRSIKLNSRRRQFLLVCFHFFFLYILFNNFRIFLFKTLKKMFSFRFCWLLKTYLHNFLSRHVLNILFIILHRFHWNINFMVLQYKRDHFIKTNLTNANFIVLGPQISCVCFTFQNQFKKIIKKKKLEFRSQKQRFYLFLKKAIQKFYNSRLFLFFCLIKSAINKLTRHKNSKTS